MNAALVIADKVVFDDGAIQEMVVWRVPAPVPPSSHSFKYRLFYGFAGRRLVGYDNERGKGDHRHIEGREEPYRFQGWEALIDDFLADVAQNEEQAMKDIDLHVGYDPAAAKARVLNAIRRAEAGPVEPESHVTFESWDGLSRALSGKRLELLRHVRQKAAASVAELARALGRDYKRVHEDVEILTAAGLLDRTGIGGVRAAYDEIRTVIRLTPAA